MNLWNCNFDTARPMASLPKLLTVAQERRFKGDGYHCQGRFRKAEKHCIFKLTLSGEGSFKDGDGVHRLPPGRGFLCHICDPATEYFYPDDASEPWTFVFVCFIGDCATAMTKELTARHGAIYDLKLDSPIARRLLACRRNAGGKTVRIRPGEGASLVFELLCALDASKARQSEEESSSALLVQRAKALIEENVPQGTSVEELASALKISREHLTRCFSKETGVSPREFETRLRMRCACRLLKESSLSVKEIGAELGMERQQHFSRFFQKAAGMTPSQVRRHGLLPEF